MASLFESSIPTVRSADGTLIWAASAGRPAHEAPSIIFVPGFSSSSLTFRKQFEDQTLLRKYCLITYEPRGQGRSEQPSNKEAYSSLKNAEDFKAVFEAFGVKKAVLAGWSYGGIIPTDVFSHLGPDWVNGVIYLSGVPWRSMLPEVLHADGAGAINLLVEPGAGGIAEGLTSVLDTCFHRPALINMPYSEYAALVGAIAEQNPEARLLLMNERQQDPVMLVQHAATLPVMLIIGEYDRQLYWEKLDAFLRRNFAKYELRLIRDAGHSSFWEKAEEVNGIIQKFVDGL